MLTWARSRHANRAPVVGSVRIKCLPPELLAGKAEQQCSELLLLLLQLCDTQDEVAQTLAGVGMNGSGEFNCLELQALPRRLPFLQPCSQALITVARLLLFWHWSMCITNFLQGE